MRYHEIVAPLDEAFTDLGKLSPEELLKGQPLDPANEDNFAEVEARVFHTAISKLRANDFAKLNAGLPSKGLHTLETYGIPKYQTMRCFLGRNNSSGFALTKDGGLVSVFSTQRSSGKAIVAAAVEFGATHLDCFALRQDGEIVGPLYRLYASAGFRIDTSFSDGTPGEAFAVVRGVSDFVDDAGDVHPDDPRVVIFMRR
jgi:phage gpG-like protein